MLEQGITDCAAALAEGKTSSAAMIEEALDRIADAAGEGGRTFTEVFAAEARTAAAAADSARAQGDSLGRLHGIPISVKDLFDIEGRVTRAGSVVLSDEAPARADAEVVRRLRSEGAVILGRTNMTEFAFSGLGLNPHYGTPASPWDRANRRIPGGSSSGAAISVTDGMAAAALGSDTGGSVRIPAALCGLVGFKPTRDAVPRDGVYPLSATLDSIGPLARSVEDCVLLHSVLSGEPVPAPALAGRSLRLGVVTNYVTQGMDYEVAAAYDAALSRLSAADVVLDRISLSALDRIPEMNRIATYPGIEAYAMQKERLANAGSRFDPRVRYRIEAAGALPGDARARLDKARADFVAAAEAEMAPYDAIVMPTVPIVAPTIDDLADDDAYGAANLLMLRNPTTINLLGGCAITLPLTTPAGASAGLTLAATQGRDWGLLEIADGLAPVVCG